MYETRGCNNGNLRLIIPNHINSIDEELLYEYRGIKLFNQPSTNIKLIDNK